MFRYLDAKITLGIYTEINVAIRKIHSSRNVFFFRFQICYKNRIPNIKYILVKSMHAEKWAFCSKSYSFFSNFSKYIFQSFRFFFVLLILSIWFYAEFIEPFQIHHIKLFLFLKGHFWLWSICHFDTENKQFLFVWIVEYIDFGWVSWKRGQ